MSNLSEDMIFDFNKEKPCDGTIHWEAIDDRIMGGCSQSQQEHIDNVGLRFTGVVSLENNGGFASIRSVPKSYNLQPYSGIKLRLFGDGKNYKLSLRTDLFFDGVSYQTSFSTNGNSWQEILLPFEAFTPTHHGIELSTVAPLDLSNIRNFGLFIADKQAGSFQLDVAWIKGVR